MMIVSDDGCGRKTNSNKDGISDEPKATTPIDSQSICQTGMKLNKQDLTPAEYFERVAVNDLKQNKRLSMSVGGARSYKLGGHNGSGGGGGEKVTRVRFIICALALMALAMSQMSRMVLYPAITQMVEEPASQSSGSGTKILEDGSCPWPEEEKEKATNDQEHEVCTSTELPEHTTMIDDLLEAAMMTETPSPEPTTTSAFEEDTMPPTASKPSGEDAEEESTGLDTNIQTRAQSEPSSPMEETGEPVDVGPPNDADPAVSRNETSQQKPVSVYPRYKWSIKQQGVLLGGFFYTYFAFMIIGGRLAEMYGAKYVLLLSVAGSALINFATPWMAATSFPLLVMSRAAMGAIQAGVFPGMYALLAKWLTMTEASIFAPLIKMNLRLGMLLGSSIPGIISGWPNVFYLTGVLSAIWSLLWWALATSDPADSPWVSAAELRLINRKKRHQTDRETNGTKNEFVSIELKETTTTKSNGEVNGVGKDTVATKMAVSSDKPPKGKKTPWLKIITNPSVIGLIIIKLTFNTALDFLAIELPSYLKYVHHASKEKVVLIVFVGWLAKTAVQRRPLGLSKTGVRKLFQGTATFGLAITFLLLTFNNCNLFYVAAMLQIASILSMFTAGGETMLPYDLSEEYPATIMAIANSVANLSGAATTTISAIVLGDQGGSFDRWNKLIYLIAGVQLIGGISFSLLVKAEPINFDESDDKQRQVKDLEAHEKSKK